MERIILWIGGCLESFTEIVCQAQKSRKNTEQRPPLLHMEKRFGYLERLPAGQLVGELFQACPNRRSSENPQKSWKDHALECLNMLPEDLEGVKDLVSFLGPEH